MLWTWRSLMLGCMAILTWIAWALWWPVEPPVRILSSRAEPAVVQRGGVVTLVQEAAVERQVVVTITQRLTSPHGVYSLPSMQEHMHPGHHELRPIIQVPPLPPGKWVYQPTIQFSATALRDEWAAGPPIEFEVLP